MAPKIIVSYDGTENDTDALALGRLLAKAGGTLTLAYVRHSREAEPGHEKLAQHEAEELLANGAEWLGDLEVPRHVVLSPSTPEGLRALAEREGADIIVFGSEYRTAPGHVAPGTSAQHLLEGGPIAIAIAPAGFRERSDARIDSIAVVGDDPDPALDETAASLAAALGAGLVPRADDEAGLVIVGSKAGTAPGRITLSAAAQYLIELLHSPVLALPHWSGLTFGGSSSAGGG